MQILAKYFPQLQTPTNFGQVLCLLKRKLKLKSDNFSHFLFHYISHTSPNTANFSWMASCKRSSASSSEISGHNPKKKKTKLITNRKSVRTCTLSSMMHATNIIEAQSLTNPIQINLFSTSCINYLSYKYYDIISVFKNGETKFIEKVKTEQRIQYLVPL